MSPDDPGLEVDSLVSLERGLLEGAEGGVLTPSICGTKVASSGV
jgi:hypothetical protein